MKTFITDMGTEYKNSIIEDLCKYLHIKNITSTAHHHQDCRYRGAKPQNTQ